MLGASRRTDGSSSWSLFLAKALLDTYSVEDLMPKNNRKVARNVFQDGPHLTSALICEKVLEEKDGVKSAIRIISRITRTIVISGPEPQPVAPVQASLALLIQFKKGKAGDKHTLRIDFADMSGEVKSSTSIDIMFEGGPDRGIDVAQAFGVQFDRDGIYWFNIFLDDIRVTRIPIRVIFLIQRQHPAALPEKPVS